MKKPRKHYTPEERSRLLRRHLRENAQNAKLCDELGLQATVFYRWQKAASRLTYRSRPGGRGSAGNGVCAIPHRRGCGGSTQLPFQPLLGSPATTVLGGCRLARLKRRFTR